jgi:hypothetical protein
MTDARAAFLAAAETFVEQVDRVPVTALTGPGLGDWDLRALVGHASRSLVTVETYLDQPADQITVPTAAAYYVAIAETLAAGGSAVVERGRQAGAALGDDPAGFVRGLAARVRAKLAGFEATYVLTMIAGGMPLDEYLRTRTFELVVHGYDIADACGVAADHDLSAVIDATTLAAEVAVATGRGRDLLLALTGRSGLPESFSVV